MLSALRKRARSWVAKLLIGLLILSFAVWGVSGFLGGRASSNVLSVGETHVSAVRFERALSIAITRLSSQLSQQISRAQAIALGAPNQVLAQLAGEAALDEIARRLNLGVSDEQLARSFAENPVFQDTEGRFDRALFQRILQANELTEEILAADQRAFSKRRQIAQAITGGVRAPDTLLRVLYTHRNEERAVRALALTPSDLEAAPSPSEEDLKSYFDEHNARYRAPEYRTIELLQLTPADVTEPDSITDAAAREAYEAQPNRFSTPERRQVQQILFSSLEEAGAAAERLAAGASWAELLAERNLSEEAIDLGLLSEEDFVDENLAAAIFASTEGEITDVVDGRFGPIIARVVKIEPAATQSFEEAAAQLKQELALDEAAELIYDAYERVEDALAGGASLSEAADAQNLSLRAIAAVDRNGLDPEGATIQDIPASAELLQKAFASDVGLENTVIEGEDFFVWYEVTEITPERDQTLEEAHTRVREDWTREKTAEALDKLAEELIAGLQSTADFEALAETRGKDIGTFTQLTRADGADRLNTLTIDPLFEKPQGSFGHFAAGDGQSRVIYQVAGITKPEDSSPLPEGAGSQIQNAMENELLDQYIASLQERLGLSLNQALLTQLLTSPEAP